MAISPADVISFGLHSGRQDRDVDVIASRDPALYASTVDLGVVNPTSSIPAMPDAYELGPNGRQLVDAALSALGASGIFDRPQAPAGGAGSGIPSLAVGEHELFAHTTRGSFAIRFGDDAPAPVLDARAAIEALRDAGMANGRASTGGAAGGLLLG